MAQYMGIEIEENPAMAPAYCGLMNQGQLVWSGRMVEGGIPENLAFDLIVLHPDDAKQLAEQQAEIERNRPRRSYG